MQLGTIHLIMIGIFIKQKMCCKVIRNAFQICRIKIQILIKARKGSEISIKFGVINVITIKVMYPSSKTLCLFHIASYH